MSRHAWRGQGPPPQVPAGPAPSGDDPPPTSETLDSTERATTAATGIDPDTGQVFGS
jgi:hypothetical protein